jgi:hypothetical protein
MKSPWCQHILFALGFLTLLTMQALLFFVLLVLILHWPWPTIVGALLLYVAVLTVVFMACRSSKCGEPTND